VAGACIEVELWVEIDCSDDDARVLITCRGAYSSGASMRARRRSRWDDCATINWPDDTGSADLGLLV